jgi:hypothetical protein
LGDNLVRNAICPPGEVGYGNLVVGLLAKKDNLLAGLSTGYIAYIN